jgi:uncharacterized OB-fold protein
VTIPLPTQDSVSEPFWEACRRGHLVVQRCVGCGLATFPPEQFCVYCLGNTLKWEACSGRGMIHSYSVVWRPSESSFAVPYVVAIVQLDEGWFMFTNVIDCPAQAVAVGMTVNVKFVQMTDQISLPYFAPVE